MYVELNILHIYLLSNISILVLRTVTALKLSNRVLVRRDFTILFVIYIYPGVYVKPVEFLLNIIYLPKSNEEYFIGNGSLYRVITWNQ